MAEPIAKSILERQVIEGILKDVEEELVAAFIKHGPMLSAHEAYGLIQEEVDEFWDEVKKKREHRSAANMRKELVQVAAMACKAAVSLNFGAIAAAGTGEVPVGRH